MVLERKYNFFRLRDELGTVHLIFWGGGAWVFFEKNFLALILAKKNNLAQWYCEKNNLSPIVTQNSLTGMFEMSKSKKIFWLAPLAIRISNSNLLARNVRIYFQTASPLVLS